MILNGTLITCAFPDHHSQVNIGLGFVVFQVNSFTTAVTYMSHTRDEMQNLRGETRLYAEDTWLHAVRRAVRHWIMNYSRTYEMLVCLF